MTELMTRSDDLAQESKSKDDLHRPSDGDDPLSSLTGYVETVLGDYDGYVNIAYGRNPSVTETGKYRTDLARHQEWYRWPEEAEKAVEAMLVADSDVYVCPYVLRGQKRQKGTAVDAARKHVHADVDLDGDQELDLAAVGGIPGAMAVGSGSPGNAHVYVMLAEPVTTERHTALCRALGEYLGTKDSSKVSDNDLLRPPGTKNYKPTVMEGGGRPPAPVDWLVPPTGDVIDPNDLATLLDVDWYSVAADPAPTEAREGIAHLEVEEVSNFSTRFPDVQAALMLNTGDRSKDTWRLLSACKKSGLNLSQARWVVNGRPDLTERLDGRGDDDLARTWERIADGVEEQPGVPSELYVDIGAMLDGVCIEAPAPELLSRTDGVALFYRGEVNIVFGDPEHGKTWVVLAACAEVLRGGGHVLVADLDHNGIRATVSRLMHLGVDEDVLRDTNTFRLCQPSQKAAVQRMVRDCTEWRPDIVVIDSTGELMPVFDSKSDSADDFTRVHNAVLQPLANTGAAVLLVDHLAKGRESRNYGPGGSMAKRRTVGGASIRAVRERAFTPGLGGAATLWVNKDRHGGLRRHCVPSRPGKDEQLAGTFILAPDGGTDTTARWCVLPGSLNAASSAGGEAFRPTALMERASKVLEGSAAAMTKTNLCKAMAGRKATALNAIAVLGREGHVEIETQGRSEMCTVVKPYRQSEDPACGPDDLGDIVRYGGKQADAQVCDE